MKKFLLGTGLSSYFRLMATRRCRPGIAVWIKPDANVPLSTENGPPTLLWMARRGQTSQTFSPRDSRGLRAWTESPKKTFQHYRH